MKKIIVLILAFCFLIYCTGCSSMQVVPKEETMNIVYPMPDLEVLTKNNERYYFKGGEYIFSMDSLRGKGTQILHSEKVFSGSIAAIDIVETKAPVLDWGKTSIFLGVIAVVITAAAIILPSLDFRMGPGGGGAPLPWH